MNSQHCRDHLQHLFDDEAAALAQLQMLLNQEHQHITGNDLDALETSGKAREICISDLLRIDAERQTLCRANGRNADKAGLANLIKWCDPSGELHSRWKANNTAIRHCRTLNDRNGILVNNRMMRVENMLGTLNKAQDNSGRTYSARGSAYSQPTAGRVCNIQA